MRYLRKWQLPTFAIHRHEEGDKPEAWGQSYFWYCAFCGEAFAWSQLYDEAATLRPYVAIGSCCSRCAGNRFTIPGSIEGSITIGWHVPLEVARYQLDCEIAFLDHEDHPYNRKTDEP